MLGLLIVFLGIFSLAYSIFRPRTRSSSQTAEKTPPVESAAQVSLRKKLGITSSESNITISLDKTNLDSFAFSGVEDAVRKLSEIARVSVIVHASSDEEEEKLRAEIELRLPDFIAKNYQHRILFYSTTVGKIAILRQMNPCIHVEHDRKICMRVQPHLRNVMYLSRKSSNSHASHKSGSKQSSSACLSSRIKSSTSVDEVGVDGVETINSVSELLS